MATPNSAMPPTNSRRRRAKSNSPRSAAIRSGSKPPNRTHRRPFPPSRKSPTNTASKTAAKGPAPPLQARRLNRLKRKPAKNPNRSNPKPSNPKLKLNRRPKWYPKPAAPAVRLKAAAQRVPPKAAAAAAANPAASAPAKRLPATSRAFAPLHVANAGLVSNLGGGGLFPGAVEARVGAGRLNQLVVAALLGDAAVFEDDNLAGAADRREAVGDDDCGAARQQSFQALLDRFLGPHIDVGGRLVEDQDAGFGQ